MLYNSNVKTKTMDKVIIFILGFPIALLIILYRHKIVAFTGKLEWAERVIGPGGTYTLLIAIAFVIWIGCMMYALGSFEQVFGFLANFF